MTTEKKVEIMLLAYKSPQRYALRRAVVAACEELEVCFPGLNVEVKDVKKRQEIETYTPVVIYPSLVLNGTLVCTGRFPRKDEIIGWLHQVLDD